MGKIPIGPVQRNYRAMRQDIYAGARVIFHVKEFVPLLLAVGIITPF